MWIIFLSIAILGVLVLMFYLVLELNELEKKVAVLTEQIKKHFEME